MVSDLTSNFTLNSILYFLSYTIKFVNDSYLISYIKY